MHFDELLSFQQSRRQTKSTSNLVIDVHATALNDMTQSEANVGIASSINRLNELQVAPMSAAELQLFVLHKGKLLLGELHTDPVYADGTGMNRTTLLLRDDCSGTLVMVRACVLSCICVCACMCVCLCVCVHVIAARDFYMHMHVS